MVRLNRNGYTLIEVLVVATIIFVLASLLMVGINGAVDRSAYITCQSKAKTLGGMIIEYAMRNNGTLPEFTKYRWTGQIGYLQGGEFGWKTKDQYPELRDRTDVGDGSYFIIRPREDKLFVCPTGKKQMMNLQGVRSSYAGLSVHDYASLDSVSDPARTMLLLEYDANDVNVIFADGSEDVFYLADSIERPGPGQTQPVELYKVARS